MNMLTMPYLLQNSQNRVENIKKKFEGPYFDERDSGNANRDSSRSFKSSPSKTKAVQVLKSGNLENENNNCDKYLAKSDLSRGDGKALVRRSPAFRREKLNYGKNSQGLSDINSYLSDNRKLIEREKSPFKANPADDANILKLKNAIVRNRTEPNILRLAESVECDSLSPDLLTKSTESLDLDKNINRSSTNDKILVQTPHSKNSSTRSCGTSKNELKITDSIRLALKAPLPKGPPPKKPPRTFVHTMNATNAPDGTQESLATVLGKDDPILKLKLKKIENVVKSLEHKPQINMPCESSRMELKKCVNKIHNSNEVNSASQITHEKPIDSFCLKKLKCIGCESYEKPFVGDRDTDRQSSFYIDCPNDSNKTDLNNSVNGKPLSLLSKRNDSEHIYDLPFINKRNNFESFGKVTTEKTRNSSNAPQHLHYMCTDVVNSVQDTKPPKIFLPPNQGENVQKDSHSDKFMKIFSKSYSVRKTCQEPSTDGKPGQAQEPKNLAKDEAKIIMNNVFNSVNVNLSNIKCNPDIDSDSGSTSSGLEESHVNVGDGTGHSVKKPEDRFVSVNNKKEALMSLATASRKTYVKRVSNHSPFSKSLNSESYGHLFESCILVGLTLGEFKTTVPYIKSIFPSNVKPPPLIESLCFPDASTWTQSSCNLQQGEQYYSLVITNENGFRKFGYCRRVLPEGGNFCLPLVYCIISPHRANGFYYKVLQELESRHGSSEIQGFIKQLYECSFPGPGQSLKLKKILEEVTRVSPIRMNENLPSTLVRRPCDVRLEERDLSQLLQHLKVSVLLKVFSSLLLERKVLLLGRSLRNLSSCIEAIQSLLHPFSWQHTFIPVLPNNLNEMCDAPTPYVIGLQKSTFSDNFLSNLNFEEGIMVDLEESQIIKCCGDEGSIIPQRMIKGLKTALNLALSASLESDNDRNVLISEAFIRFFVEICGSYSNFIVKQPEGRKIFQKEEFVNSMPAIQPFLDWFVETAMFRSFIQERIQNDVEDLFKRRAMEHTDETDRSTTMFSKHYKGVNRKVKTLGDRIKDLTLFSK